MGTAIATYAAFSKNDNLRLHSSSGAVFPVLAQKVLEQGGVVYGVTMNDDCSGAEFRRADTLEKLVQLTSSKYLQASVGNTFRNVREDLKKGLLVLFTGTGCQINGLRLFLSKDYDNLLCVDVLCHGVPSPKVWKEYKAFREININSSFTGVNFRDKKLSWQEFGMSEIYKDGRKAFIPKEQNPFLILFLDNISLRPSCYQCKARDNRFSDLTLGDFWGIDRINRQLNDGKGLSLILIRTEKGGHFFQDCKDKLYCKAVSYAEAIAENPPEYQSPEMPQVREQFFKDLNQKNFGTLVDQYAEIPDISVASKAKAEVKRLFLHFHNSRKAVE